MNNLLSKEVRKITWELRRMEQALEERTDEDIW